MKMINGLRAGVPRRSQLIDLLGFFLRGSDRKKIIDLEVHF